VILFLVLIVILLIGLTTAAVMGKIGGFMADPTSTQSFSGIPDGALSTDGLAQLHFDQALRGYRMDQVDQVIDALAARVRELESASRPEVVSSSVPAVQSTAESESSPVPGVPSTAQSDPHDVSGEPQE
jgi:DivIVA domain-containing protein